ncbi:MAG: hypothetical protein Q4A55_06615 [Aerococcus sp.]|nr:hypothetical protein [Aerococcus sp.]
MSIQFYLDIEGKRYMLPVNPGEIKVKKGMNQSTVEIVKAGDVLLDGTEKLADLSLSSIFPKDYEASYVNAEAPEKAPKEWVKIIHDAQANNDKVRLIVTECDINIETLITSFQYEFNDATGDVEYTIDLKEHRPHVAKFIKMVTPPPRPAPKNKPITIGCTVIVNGQLHRDSYGMGPGVIERNAKRKVNFIVKGRKYPYHVTLLNGGWRGWVTPESVKRV